jgi:flagellar assembly protein FliH
VSAITSERKFLFDTNNFDVPDIPEVDPDMPPPPPVFSLEDLGMTRDEGFNQGRLAGLEEAAASREQYIASQLERLAHDFKGVLLAEKMRERTYETEVLSLCEAIFARAFPELNRIHGMSEVLQIIREVLVNQQEQSRLVIDVPQGELDEIRAELEKIPEYDSAKVDLRETPDLHRGSCRISWQNGGALRDHNAIAARIAAEIAGELKHSLAPAPQKDDNSNAPAASSGEE